MSHNGGLKILIGCLFFHEYTGSELYVLELSKALVKRGHQVSVASMHMGSPLAEVARQYGIKTYSLHDLPPDIDFDIIHSQHVSPTQFFLEKYPLAKKICTIHSEIIPEEAPQIHSSILRYVAIRPEIKQFLVNTHKIPEENISLVYNPIDDTRFNTEDITDENAVLFVGTIDELRKRTLFDLVLSTQLSKKQLWLVGRNCSGYLDVLLSYPHVKYFDRDQHVETYVKRCSEVAGILLGRTTIEGWMCGKPAWIYDVISNGSILSKKLVPPPDDLEKFKSSYVLRQIELEYFKLCKSV